MAGHPILPLTSASSSRSASAYPGDEYGRGLGGGSGGGSGSGLNGDGFGGLGMVGGMGPRSDRSLPVMLRRLTKFKSMVSGHESLDGFA